MDGPLAFLRAGSLVVASGLAGLAGLAAPLSAGPATSAAPLPPAAPQKVAWAEDLDLSNDAFLPTGEDAAARIVEGDAAWSDVPRGPFDAAGPPRAALEAFESWHAALALSSGGDAVPHRDFPPAARGDAAGATGPALAAATRGTEGVEAAVLRRLAALEEPARLAFRRRFEALAETALGAEAFAWPPAPGLLRIEREHPLTVPAARAALALCEAELEAGRPERARTWLARAERHAGLGGFADARWSTALERRRAACRGRAAPEARAPEAWTTARELELIETFAFHEVPPSRTRLPGGIRPGGAFLDDGRLVVQTGDAVVALDPEDPLPVTLLASDIVEKLLGWSFERPRGVPGGEWTCRPATDGAAIVVVAGYGDALLCLESPLPGAPARLRWALSEDGAFGPDGVRGAGEVLPDAAFDFQPGPVILEGRVYVQARQWNRVDAGQPPRTGKPRALLLAVDLATGELAWTRLLALGSDLRGGTEERLTHAGFGLPALPPAAVAGRIFAGTQLGVGSLLDAADGRLTWSFQNRRRAPNAPGWSAAAPTPMAVPCDPRRAADEDRPPPLVWGPADSDFLYWMRPEAGLAPSELLARPPEPLAGARELIAGNACEAVVTARVGARGALARWTPDSGERTAALFLRREEEFRGTALASPARVFFTTDRGLYVLDRERDLYLVQHLALPSLRPQPGPTGGSVLARGDRIAVVGHGDLWLFRVLE